MTRLCISVDVEGDLPGVLRDGLMRGVEEGLPKLLSIFNQVHLKADFFFLAPIANENAELVARIAKAGHGIGNHGLDHRLLCAKSLEKQRGEIMESTRILERVCASRPTMFRAPNFSANNHTVRILQGLGYSIDSSVLPGRYLNRFGILRVYDHRGAPQEPHRPLREGGGQEGLSVLEVPVTENPLQPGTPIGLGALNRLGPTRLIQFLETTALDTVVFLAHPWEAIDILAAYPSAPDDYGKVCSGDVGSLRTFLEAARSIAEFSTLDQVADVFRGG